jgi:putative membrane protein
MISSTSLIRHAQQKEAIDVPRVYIMPVCHSARSMVRNEKLPLALLAIVAAALIVSAIAPTDRLTWWLEALPVLIALPLLTLTARRFPLTHLLYVLIACHALVLLLGAHYTYAKVPLGDWARDTFGLMRNPYDRLGHLVQGFVPAIIAREILLRKTVLQPGGWLFFIVSSICLAFSACFELFEWLVAVIGGGSADQYLATQGDIWDTQWDMLCALIGSVIAQLTLGRLHDRELARLGR